MMSRFSLGLLVLGALALVGCDTGSSSESCLTVSPDESYTLSGVAGSTSFAPASTSYTVRNTCSEDIDLTVDEGERWLDVEIGAFEPAESGPLPAGGSVAVVIELRYGSDSPERLDQLDPGSYSAEIHFEDDTNDTRVVRNVELTVQAPNVVR